MRRFIVTGCLVGLVSALSFGSGQTYSGCGLGYMLLSHDSDSKVAQILGATTNHSSGTQTFGITTGTCGCNTDGSLTMGKESMAYAEANFESLRREMAVGKGEYVETFAALLGATESTRPDLLKFFQSEYTRLFPSTQTTADEMLSILQARMAERPYRVG
jgi:hypothetical protein